MKYLLDTHTFLWLAADPDKLSDSVREIVIKPENELLLSAASGWESALLWKLNRIALPEEPVFFIPQVIKRYPSHRLPLVLKPPLPQPLYP